MGDVKKTVTEKISADEYTTKLPYANSKLDPVGHAQYHAEQSRLESQFKLDCLTELGRVGHPKADTLYAIAWQMGHAYGYSEVWSHMRDLDELLT